MSAIKFKSNLAIRKVIPGSVGTANFDEEIVSMRRVTNVTSGGRTFSFSTFAVVGNYAGFFGFGKAKANEAIAVKKKAFQSAKRNLYFLPLRANRTIFHTVTGQSGASSVILRPAKLGTGIIAANNIKILLELIGIKDIVVKSHGPANSRTMILAAIDALFQLQNPKSISKLRNKTLAEITKLDEDGIPFANNK